LQLYRFLLEALGQRRVAPLHYRPQELPIGFATGEIPAAPQQQRLVHGVLQPPMALLAIAILVTARRVGRLGGQTIMSEQGLVFRCVLIEVPFLVHRQRHAIRPMAAGHAVQLPQRVLQALA
jgi:hypothetical protein